MPELLDPNDLLTPSDAARVLGLSADSVRVLSDSGRLPSMRTIGGRRLFRRGDVDRLALERASHAVAGAAISSRRGRMDLNAPSAAPAPNMK
ncbi:MAG TPA: helix-turn-helix domain-containing protein [Polyangia bacterium]|jgi:excisionase family DNA binding protein|nr:helix-turn-helix domain-containing protein [Polyangia bacterium]